MAKITSKLQVTLPKALADQYGIRPGDEIQWVAAGDTIRVIPSGRAAAPADNRMRVELFDEATRRQKARHRKRGAGSQRKPRSRGWTRDELYARGGSR